ncbi:MAG TPA: SDR family oxidoreductase [Terriglobia bacterium]|nr:SDR family oxidoreductase [Terriglobia bacterium]
MQKLNGKTAIVTGGSRGIGRAIALRLAQDGANVVVCARGAEALEEVVLTIAKTGGTASSIVADLRDPVQPARVASFAIEMYGGIDIIVNNAGATRRGEFVELSDDDWADGFALKFFGAVRLTRAAWPQLKARAGSLLNISGAGGRTPGPEFTIGGSVNAAVLSFTKAMADVGIRDGVQVNAINPGTIRTARMKMRLATISESQFVKESQITRIGEPEDVANLVAYVVGPEGRFLQGSLIDLDGGSTKTM